MSALQVALIATLAFNAGAVVGGRFMVPQNPEPEVVDWSLYTPIETAPKEDEWWLDAPLVEFRSEQ